MSTAKLKTYFAEIFNEKRLLQVNKKKKGV